MNGYLLVACCELQYIVFSDASDMCVCNLNKGGGDMASVAQCSDIVMMVTVYTH